MTRYFFNCDWGTSRFRLRLVDAASRSILIEQRSDEGVASLSSLKANCRETQFRDVLDRHIARMLAEVSLDLSEAPILISGMASSSIGWRDLPYAALPFTLDGSDLHFIRLDQETPRSPRPIFLFSGICSDRDVMRGEEIEMIGLRALAPESFLRPGDLWVVLPGTHSKHVRVQQETIVEFHTHLTGELFHLLCRHSSLRDPNGEMKFAGADKEREMSGWQKPFSEGVELAQQGELNAGLFQVRARQLLRKENAMQSAAFLSGMLIGSELQSLLHSQACNSTILLAAAADLYEPYRIAFDQLGLSEQTIIIPPADVARLSALGQHRALQRISSESSGRHQLPPDAGSEARSSSIAVPVLRLL